MLVLYGAPDDPETFDRHYAETHVPLTLKLPGLREFKVSRGDVVAGGDAAGDGAPYLIASLAWRSLPELEDSLASPEGAAATADLEKFATGGWRLWRYEEQPAGDTGA